MMTFWKWAGVVTGVRDGDWPEKVERLPDAYEPNEINALLSAATTMNAKQKTASRLPPARIEEERLILQCLLFSGLRDGELAHLTYDDIRLTKDSSVWNVQPKPNWNWKPKTVESIRSVPVIRRVTEKLLERKRAKGAAASDLIFPSEVGKPDGHLLRIVKRVAKRAGVVGRVDNHKFRATAITLWLRAGATVPDVMGWVGHKDAKTILRYAKRVTAESRETQRLVAAPFTEYVAIGD